MIRNGAPRWPKEIWNIQNIGKDVKDEQQAWCNVLLSHGKSSMINLWIKINQTWYYSWHWKIPMKS